MVKRTESEGSQGDVELSPGRLGGSKVFTRMKKVKGAMRANSDGFMSLKSLKKLERKGGAEAALKRRSSVQTIGANAWGLIGGPTDPETTGDEGTGGVGSLGLKLIKVTFNGEDSERTEMVTLSAINTWKVCMV